MNGRLREELDYCVPLGIPHSRFLSWSEEDQDKALAYLREMAQVCSDCGTRGAEWVDDKFAYIGDSVRCSGCEVLAQERRNVPDGAGGVRVRLLPRAVAELRMEQGEGIVDGLP